MAYALSAFFAAWSETDADARRASIAGAMGQSFIYADPRQPTPLNDVDALDAYVAAFAANAPGWVARVVKTDSTGEYARVTVSFEGKGPDGAEVAQLGQYFAQIDPAQRISLLVGFVGTGTP